MAMSLPLTGAGKRGGKNLICGVCRDVYRSPRLLPCFHTFCLYCLEGLTRAQDHVASFPCPECRAITTVPPKGALGFQQNFYITEEELELERNGPSIAMCPVHNMEPLVFFCVPCDLAICIRCRLTKHSDHHETQDLSEAAARCSDYLIKSKDRLESTISLLTKKSTTAQENLKAAKEKGLAIKQEVHSQHGLLIKRIETILTDILKRVDLKNTLLEATLTQDAQLIQKELDFLVQLRQSVHHALRAEASDADKVFVEKEMREGKGSEASLLRIKESLPDTTFRPGLHFANDIVSDGDILRVLGDPVTLAMPLKEPREVIVPVFQHRKKDYGREVYWLCQRSPETWTVFVWDSPAHKTINIQIDEKGKVVYNERVTPEKMSCKRYAERRYFRSTFQFITEEGKNGYRVNSKGFHDQIFQVEHLQGERTCINWMEVKSFDPFAVKAHHIQDINPAKPAAFDASSTGNMFAVVEAPEKEQPQPDNITERQVCDASSLGNLFSLVEAPEKEQPQPDNITERQVSLYRRDQRTPFATYTPLDCNFCPSDVCFWQENDQEQLLVADRQNDCVHVVSIHENQLHFERYLGAGDGNLVRPTALNVDDKGRVWIGCENGRVLRCETHQAESKAADERADVEGDALSLASGVEGSSVGSLLAVENISTRSQMSEAVDEIVHM